jgi:hypothetical protein
MRIYVKTTNFEYRIYSPSYCLQKECISNSSFGLACNNVILVESFANSHAHVKSGEWVLKYSWYSLLIHEQMS